MSNNADKMIADIEKFSLAEMTNNSNGKTSGSGAAGIYLVFIGGIILVMGAIAGLFFDSVQTANVLLAGSGSCTLGASLLGYRKSVDKTALENGKDPSSLEGGNNPPAEAPAEEKK